ncbi:hypothetical protein [Pseudomonas sp. BF-R-19]|uniref:hypothetical protein n=1 Tax=Pseudomonas sp. BF-R-19 TaxID=2832397 RepID=UPI001CBB35CB|nr:hypothetical protein [Pseudomonas sp. BF-R-19]
MSDMSHRTFEVRVDWLVCETLKTFREAIIKHGESSFRTGISLVAQGYGRSLFLHIGAADFHHTDIIGSVR